MVKTLSMGPMRLWYDTVDPGISETGVQVFNWWLNTASGQFFLCIDETIGAQAWEQGIVQGDNISAGNITLANAAALRTSTGAGNTLLLQAYDVDGAAYATFGTLTANNTPTMTLAPTSITFSGETAFNHYFEQQTFTPTVSGSAVAGAGTYTLQSGYYTRIGNMIFIQMHVSWSAHTGSGDLLVTDFPFTCRNSSNYHPEGIVNTINVALPGGTSRTVLGSLQPNTTTMDVYVTTNAGTNTNVALSASGTIHVTVSYLT